MGAGDGSRLLRPKSSAGVDARETAGLSGMGNRPGTNPRREAG